MKKDTTKKTILTIAGIAVFIGIFVLAMIAFGGDSRVEALEKALDLGIRYLNEMDYEKALAAYQDAIKIDSKCETAYLGAADAYMGLGDYEGALEILASGYEAVQLENLAARRDEIEAEYLEKAGQNEGQGAEGTRNQTPPPSQASAETEESGNQDEEPVRPQFIPWAEASLEDHVMDWQDEKLEAAMREITGITDRDIMLSDVWELKELELTGKGIVNINALGELKNLTYLNLWFNEISDISALGELASLTYLAVSENRISDISALGGLASLIDLELRTNQISNISALVGLASLTYLELEENQISDISALSELTSLTYLSLYSNQISDISALGGLTSLTHLVLSGNRISDIDALGGLTSLIYLDLGDNPISDYSPVSFVENLYHD